MDIERIVDDYNDAWNRRDIARLRQLIDKRARYYDAFWMEYSYGGNLSSYLLSWLEEEHCWYERVSDISAVDGSFVYRYVARERTPSGAGSEIYSGAEVISLRDGKIISISDFYCNPDPLALEEIARLTKKYHGEIRHAQSGLGALRSMRYKRHLITLIEEDRVFLDKGLTQIGLARQLVCSVDHLLQVIADTFGTNFHNLVDGHRVRFARKLIRDNSNDPERLPQIADQSGFSSVEELNAAFRRITGELPLQYIEKNSGATAPPGNSGWH